MAATYIELGHKRVFLAGTSSDGTNSESAPFTQDVNVVTAVGATPTPGASSMTKAEDAAHVSGDVGVAVFAKRTDTAAASSATDGDYVTINEDSLGRVWVNPGIIQNEDAVHVSGDSGVQALSVRKDTAAAIAADGDYHPQEVDGSGRVWTHVGAIDAGTNTIGATRDAGPSWTSSHGVSSAPFNSADASSAASVTDAPTAGQKLVITDIIFSVGDPMSVTFRCETTDAIIAGPFYCAANTSYQFTPRSKGWKLATADKTLQVIASATGSITVDVHYYSEA